MDISLDGLTQIDSDERCDGGIEERLVSSGIEQAVTWARTSWSGDCDRDNWPRHHQSARERWYGRSHRTGRIANNQGCAESSGTNHPPQATSSGTAIRVTRIWPGS